MWHGRRALLGHPWELLLLLASLHKVQTITHLANPLLQLGWWLLCRLHGGCALLVLLLLQLP